MPTVWIGNFAVLDAIAFYIVLSLDAENGPCLGAAAAGCGTVRPLASNPSGKQRKIVPHKMVK